MTQVVQFLPNIKPGDSLPTPPETGDNAVEWHVRVVSDGATVQELTWVVNEWLPSDAVSNSDPPVTMPEPEEAPAVQQTRVELERLATRSLGYTCSQCGRDFVPGTECICTGGKLLDVRMDGGGLLYNREPVFTEPTSEQIKTFVETSGIRACDTCGQLTLIGVDCLHGPVSVVVTRGMGIGVEPAVAQILPVGQMNRIDALGMMITLLGGPEAVGRLIGQPESYVRSWLNGARPRNAEVQTLIDDLGDSLRSVFRKSEA